MSKDDFMNHKVQHSSTIFLLLAKNLHFQATESTIFILLAITKFGNIILYFHHASSTFDRRKKNIAGRNETSKFIKYDILLERNLYFFKK